MDEMKQWVEKTGKWHKTWRVMSAKRQEEYRNLINEGLLTSLKSGSSIELTEGAWKEVSLQSRKKWNDNVPFGDSYMASTFSTEVAFEFVNYIREAKDFEDLKSRWSRTKEIWGIVYGLAYSSYVKKSYYEVLHPEDKKACLLSPSIKRSFAYDPNIPFVLEDYELKKLKSEMKKSGAKWVDGPLLRTTINESNCSKKSGLWALFSRYKTIGAGISLKEGFRDSCELEKMYPSQHSVNAPLSEKINRSRTGNYGVESFLSAFLSVVVENSESKTSTLVPVDYDGDIVDDMNLLVCEELKDISKLGMPNDVVKEISQSVLRRAPKQFFASFSYFESAVQKSKWDGHLVEKMVDEVGIAEFSKEIVTFGYENLLEYIAESCPGVMFRLHNHAYFNRTKEGQIILDMVKELPGDLETNIFENQKIQPSLTLFWQGSIIPMGYWVEIIEAWAKLEDKKADWSVEDINHWSQAFAECGYKEKVASLLKCIDETTVVSWCCKKLNRHSNQPEIWNVVEGMKEYHDDFLENMKDVGDEENVARMEKIILSSNWNGVPHVNKKRIL